MSDAASLRDRPPGPFSPLSLSIILGVVLVDQAAKYAAEAMLPFGRTIELLPVLSLMRTHNPGIAFSLLRDLGSVALIAVVLGVTAAVLWIWIKASDGGRLAAIGYALIVGGAIGNIIDRVRFGYVIDYLFLHVDLADQRVALFVFNLADAALTLGPVVLIGSMLFHRRAAADG